MYDIHAPFLTGHIIRGRYRITDLLGQGAFGAVYLVRDEHNSQKLFALKEVVCAVRGEQRGLFSEASTLKRLGHPALPSVHQVFDSDNHDRFYMLMDYVKGTNLEVLQQGAPGRRFSLPRAMTLMSPVMDAVSYLHRQHPHLVHGDIEPSNIITLPVGSPTPSILVDMGGIRDVKADADAAADQGSRNYRAPEQFGGKASRRSDVYALGAVFYTLLTGTVPVAASERLARLDEGKPDPLLRMNQVTPHIRTTVAEVIHCALSIRRRDRYNTVEQFWSALWQVIYDDPIMVDLANEEQSWLDDMSDASRSGGEFAPLLANATFQMEARSSTAAPELPGSSSFVGAGNSPMSISFEEKSGALSRMKRRHTVIPTGLATAPKRKRRPLKRRQRWARRLSRAGLLLLLICIIGSGVAFAGYQTVNARYQNGLGLASVGVKHLQTALSLLQTLSKNPLATSPVSQAQQEFVAASVAFTQINTELQPLPGAASSLPVYGTRLGTALRVVPLALKISQAGLIGCAALNVIVSRLHSPLSGGQGLTVTDLKEIDGDFHQLEGDIAQATAQVNALQPADFHFDARIGKLVAAFHTVLPSLQSLLQTVDQLLPALPALLGIGTQAYYLVEVLDSTQLQPGGGFIKDYGFADLLGGQLSTAHVANAALLDSSFAATGHTLAYPPAYRWFGLSKNWNLRDSNLDADFPTDARYAEQNYHLEGGEVALQGVIALTPSFMEHTLAITGPISIPALNETITAQNLIDRLHYYELGPGYQGSGTLLPDGRLTRSRYFTELLAEQLLARVHQLPSLLLPQLLQLLVNSLHTKDLQIYFNSSPAEKLLRLLNVSSQIQAPASDSLLLVDANLAGDTANQFITSSLNDQVTIDASGNVTHHTTIRYAWSKPGNVFGSPTYSDYLRVYLPPGSTLQAQQGWQSRGMSEAFGREVQAGFFSLSAGQTRTITLTWLEKGAAKKDATGWHYQYLLQRQAGSQWMLHLQVALPSCAIRTQATGGLVVHNGQTATLTRSLMEDLHLGINYTC